MEKTVIHAQVDKETKNAVVFSQKVEAGTPDVVRSLYLPKWYVGSTKNIRITIEEDK